MRVVERRWGVSENGVGRGANAAVVGAWLLWSCDPVIVRYLGADFPRLVMLAIGCLCGGLIFVVPAWRGAAVLRRRPKLLLLFVCYVLFSTALADFCYVNAIKYLHPGLVGLALRSQLAFAIFAAWVFLGETISRWTALGMLLVLGAYGQGVYFAWVDAAAAGDNRLWGWVFAFCSAILWTFGTIGGKILLRELKPRSLSGLRLLSSGMIMLILSLCINGVDAYAAIQPAEWLLLIGKGVFVSGLAFGLYLYGLKWVNVAVASAWEQLAPLFTIIISVLWLGETINGRQAFTVAVVILGAIMIILARAWDERKFRLRN
jgi:drug/metabolite transporter (DMT)-like permease